VTAGDTAVTARLPCFTAAEFQHFHTLLINSTTTITTTTNFIRQKYKTKQNYFCQATREPTGHPSWPPVINAFRPTLLKNTLQHKHTKKRGERNRGVDEEKCSCN